MTTPIIHTSVEFDTDDQTLLGLVRAAEAVCRANIRDFGGVRVLVEGGNYDAAWIETQPMGGEMYAKRDLDAAWNNSRIFLDYQLMNGRFPYKITRAGAGRAPAYGQFQGFCFPHHALNLYYWDRKRDREYLRWLGRALAAFDDYLWTYRDSDGDGCLESWCVWDTGEDNSNRFAGTGLFTGGFPGEEPPVDPVFPVESMDVMAYSYDARRTCARINRALGREGAAAGWETKARWVAEKIRSYLWDEARGACFDRDRNNAPMAPLQHNNLRVMYAGAFDEDMAGRFVREHLMNPAEFFTAMPLPSIAANDPAFRNVKENNWSGQSEGLTFQRAIRALENYGYYAELAAIGRRLLDCVAAHGNVFTQQFDPFTGEPSEPEFRGGYGPTALAALEYVSRFHGVHVQGDEVWWGCMGGSRAVYTQRWDDDAYTLESAAGECRGYLNGSLLFRVTSGTRVVTDWIGRVKFVINQSDVPLSVECGSHRFSLLPNAVS